MGGKPSKGTSKDKRLSANKSTATNKKKKGKKGTAFPGAAKPFGQ